MFHYNGVVFHEIDIGEMHDTWGLVIVGSGCRCNSLQMAKRPQRLVAQRRHFILCRVCGQDSLLAISDLLRRAHN